MADITKSDGDQLVSFIKKMNAQLPTIFAETKNLAVRPKPDPTKASFLNVLDTYILSKDDPKLAELKSSYEKLPESIKDVIKNELDHEDVVAKQEDKLWLDKKSTHTFFDTAVYETIHKSSTNTVSADILFAQQEKKLFEINIKEIAKELGMGDKQIFSERDVGRIAQKILNAHAEALCIDKQDINNATHLRKHIFLPDINDLHLVERGFGFPPDIEARAQQLGVEREWELHVGTDAVSEHQSAAFAANYGPMHIDFVKEKARLYHDQPEAEQERLVRSVYESPASFFGIVRWNDPDDHMTPYDIRRENIYLPMLKQKYENGELNLCATPAPDKRCPVEDKVKGLCGKGEPPPKSPPPPPEEEEECTVEDKVKGLCGKGFSDQAALDTTSSNAIATNISEITGHDIENYPVEQTLGVKTNFSPQIRT